jgi:hypothetical protein
MRYFREKYKPFPKGKLVKSESPDFILKVNRKKQIGIELTRFDYLANDGSSRDEILMHLGGLIAQKEDKLKLYRKKLLNEYWLVITAESHDLNKEIEKIMSSGNIFTSSFDKVFFFELFSARITEIR